MNTNAFMNLFTEIEGENKDKMNGVFNELAHKTGKSLVDSLKDHTLLFREFAILLKVIRIVFEHYLTLFLVFWIL